MVEGRVSIASELKELNSGSFPSGLTVDNDQLLALSLAFAGQVLLDLGQAGRAGGGQSGEEGGEGEGLRGCLTREREDDRAWVSVR